VYTWIRYAHKYNNYMVVGIVFFFFKFFCFTFWCSIPTYILYYPRYIRCGGGGGGGYLLPPTAIRPVPPSNTSKIYVTDLISKSVFHNIIIIRCTWYTHMPAFRYYFLIINYYYYVWLRMKTSHVRISGDGGGGVAF